MKKFCGKVCVWKGKCEWLYICFFFMYVKFLELEDMMRIMIDSVSSLWEGLGIFIKVV